MTAELHEAKGKHERLQDEMGALFHKYDADGDGTITTAELRAILRAAKPDAPDAVIERAAAKAMQKGVNQPEKDIINDYLRPNNKKKVVIRDINPKSLTSNELYGYVNM